MMRVLIDANVLAPGFLSKTSNAALLVRSWRKRDFELIVSEHLLGELADTYLDPYFRQRVSSDRVARIIALLRKHATVTDLTVVVSGVATQPKDDLVLSAALSANADYLVTRDRQMLKIAEHRGVQIVRPGRLLAVFEVTERFEVSE